MLGAIAGDIIGSVYERHNIKTTDFPLFGPRSRFTDDTIFTVALADAIMSGESYADKLKEYYHYYPNAGYGSRFKEWAQSVDSKPYNSFGNGSAMRTSPVGWAYDTMDEVLFAAEKYAAVTHNHPEGIKGARVVAAAIFMARKGSSKEEIKKYIVDTFDYNLSRTIDEIRPHYRFDVSCQGSVPQAITAFLESNDYEDAIRKAISIGGDSDTIACITGGIAEAFYGSVPLKIGERTMKFLEDRLRSIVTKFREHYVS